jgi:DNA-binding IclR family transcriptional regulator
MSEPKADYTNEAQQRILKLALLLAGNEFAGVPPAVLARELGSTASNMTRDLYNLRKAGYAEEVTPGRWRLGPRLVQVAVAFAGEVGRMKTELDELSARYTRRP